MEQVWRGISGWQQAVFSHFINGIYFSWYYYSDWQLDKLTGKLLVLLPDTASWGGAPIIMARWAPGTVPYNGANIHKSYISYMDIELMMIISNITMITILCLVKIIYEWSCFLDKQKNGTGISKLGIKSQFNVYPNPSSNGTFIIEYKWGKIANDQHSDLFNNRSLVMPERLSWVET